GFFKQEITCIRLPRKSCFGARRERSSVGGFTLVEVVISSVIFSFLAAGLFASALQVRKWSEASVRESISTAVATGFLEQLAATDFPNIIARIEDRSQPFAFVSRDGQPLDPAQSLRSMNDTDWGDPISIPLVNERDDDGNNIDGPGMNFWFIPSVERSADTPNDSVDIRIRYRWDSGQGRDVSALPVRSLFLVRPRVPQ
ncbi:MAG: prepilin-type N-terminal cleavage/methylation domain-containing protein, partial [Verrucomicrobia bacterium]|nr:prepilin-type N-terminal cleavage/methylation domain-containing protein [Verrucomicrobiota bacterium]